MNRAAFAHVLAWVLVIVSVISSLPSELQRELQVSLQRLQVPAVATAAATNATQYGRATVFLYVAGTFLLHALERVRVRLGRRQTTLRPLHTNVSIRNDVQNELRAELRNVQRNRNSLQQVYVHEFVSRVLTKALANELDDRLARYITATRVATMHHEQKVRNLKREHNTNVKSLLRTIGISLDRERALERELVDMQARLRAAHRAMATASREMTTLNSELYEIGARLEDLEKKNKKLLLENEELRLQRNALQANHLQDQQHIQDLTADVKNQRNRLYRSSQRERNLASVLLTNSANRTRVAPSAVNAMTRALRRSKTM